MAQININKIPFGNLVGGSQTFTIEYKVWNGSAYTLVTANAILDVDGNLISPVSILGLISGQRYHVRVSNNCGSPIVYFQKEIIA